jgi:hypothetical protein
MRAIRTGSVTALLVVGCVMGCSRHGRTVSGLPGEAGAPPPGESAGIGPRFSRPIAATVVPGAGVVIAGLVVPSASIVATLVEPGGAARWTTPVLSNVAWSGSSELSVLPAPDAVIVVWRGLRGGKRVTQAVIVGRDGSVRGDPSELGAAACTTDDMLFWIEQARPGTAREGGSSGGVRMRPWGSPVPLGAVPIPEERDPVLVCASHRAFLLGEGETDMTATALPLGDAGAGVTLVRDQDFGADEEDEHNELTVADVLGLVRVGRSGSVAVRELDGDRMSRWRRASIKLGPDDDLVAIDGDPRSVLVVITRDASDRCSGASAVSVHALRIARADDDADAGAALLDLAPYDCAAERGPFWTGVQSSSFVVGWAERSHADGGGAPIAALGYRVVGDTPSGEVRRIERSADELVSAGCDRERCFAVALVRPPGQDGMQPEPVEVLAYP